jgi:hypothetical protein
MRIVLHCTLWLVCSLPIFHYGQLRLFARVAQLLQVWLWMSVRDFDTGRLWVTVHAV